MYASRNVCHARSDRENGKDAKYNTRTKFLGRDIFMTDCDTTSGQTRRDTHTQAHDDDVSLISHNFQTPKVCRVHAVRVRVGVRVRDKCLFALFSPRGSAFSVGLGG